VAHDDRPLILSWLMLLGWQIETDCREGIWAGVARHVAEDGAELKVGGCARSHGEMAWQLFSGAVEALQRERGERTLAAA
jgi:hypothetical protein